MSRFKNVAEIMFSWIELEFVARPLDTERMARYFDISPSQFSEIEKAYRAGVTIELPQAAIASLKRTLETWVQNHPHQDGVPEQLTRQEDIERDAYKELLAGLEELGY